MSNADDIKTVTRQEAFDRFWDLFVVQGLPRCADEDGDCLYYKPGHPGCAVGCLLDEEDRKRLGEIDGDGIVFLASSDRVPPHIRKRLGLDDRKQVAFLKNLQRLHDFFAGKPNVRQSAEVFAARHGLAIPQAEGGAA